MWLTIRSGNQRGTSLHVNGEGFVVGRDEQCELVLSDGRVSRRHARLESHADGRASLHDLGSGNGTWVNGERVQSRNLTGNEQIQVGDTVLVTSLEEPGDGSGATVIGKTPPARSQSGLHRLVVQRSARRATILSGAAIGIVTVAGALFATGVLRPGDGDSTNAVQDVVRAAAPSTVLIEGRAGERRVGSGSGWVLDADEGLIATNAHVVDGGDRYEVVAGGRPREATVLGLAPCEDLAVLQVKDRSGLETMPLGTQSSLELGQTTVAVGYPSNASQKEALTSTTGVVSVVRTAYREAALDIPRYPNVIQTDAAINEGNSGGPLLDLEGRLIGVNSAGRSLSPDGRIVQGQNYAIGVDRVKQVTSVLRKRRSLAWTGLTLDYPTPEELDREALPPGLKIDGVIQGTGERASGLLVAVDGESIDNTLASYCTAMGDLGSGDSVALSVLEPGASAATKLSVPLR